MRVCLAQINNTPGDFAGNKARIIRGVERAVAEDADLIAFPELTIPGYLGQDLIYNDAYVESNLQVLGEIVKLSHQCPEKLHIAIGYIDRNSGKGKPYRNMAGVINAGKLIATYQKQLLPFYDVFDEARYFEPGAEDCIIKVAGARVGIAICEDLWNDKDADDYRYADNPYARYREAKVDVVVSLNSSPFESGKCGARHSHLVPATEKGPTLVYVNQVGGHDELVFDGRSFVAREGHMRFLSDTLFEDSFPIVDLAGDLPQVEVKEAPLTDLLVLGLKDYAIKTGFQQLALASSGGVDSAVVCKLACDALGPENVHAIRMPSVFSSPEATSDARDLHRNLGCRDYEAPVAHEPMLEMLNTRFRANERDTTNYNSVADENIQARLRDLYLMHFSNAFGAMPLATGNKTESGCGYYTHFDMNFSYAPIKDLYKFQVVDIAKADPRVPRNIWRKPPSAELSHNQTDETSLLPYAALDPIVMAYIEHYVTSYERFRAWALEQIDKEVRITGDADALRVWLDADGARESYRRIVSLIGRMEYKRRQTCPGTKVSKVAFGIGRRIPLVEKWS